MRRTRNGGSGVRVSKRNGTFAASGALGQSPPPTSARWGGVGAYPRCQGASSWHSSWRVKCSTHQSSLFDASPKGSPPGQAGPAVKWEGLQESPPLGPGLAEVGLLGLAPLPLAPAEGCPLDPGLGRAGSWARAGRCGPGCSWGPCPVTLSPPAQCSSAPSWWPPPSSATWATASTGR